jgi:hypothetical protein
MQLNRVLMLMAGLLVACGGDDEGETEAGADALKACFMDFTADVRSGPNAGLKLEGELMIFERAGADPLVAFAQKGASEGATEPASIPATFANGQVTLTFAVAQGNIVGTGPMSADLSTCPEELVGDLVGPADGDSGDWIALVCLANPSACIAAVSIIARATCFSGCSLAGNSDSVCNMSCGTNN